VFVAAQAVDNERFRASVPDSAITEFRNFLSLDDRPVFTFVGRMTEEKGLDILMRASALVDAPHQLVVAGSGPVATAIQGMAASLGIGERVRFIGHVPQAELPTLLRASDALVLPSVETRRVKETWGLVVNEAMNCNLPVIGSDAVGAAAGGLLVDQETGLVTPQRDAGALAAAIQELVTDGRKRRLMGAAGSARVLAWNYSAAADGFEAALGAAARNVRGRGFRQSAPLAS
jgi:glycosyltransferase involved in cell wall biosynthesis